MASRLPWMSLMMARFSTVAALCKNLFAKSKRILTSKARFVTGQDFVGTRHGSRRVVRNPLIYLALRCFASPVGRLMRSLSRAADWDGRFLDGRFEASGGLEASILPALAQSIAQHIVQVRFW